MKIEVVEGLSKKMDIKWTVSERSGWEVKIPCADFDQEIGKLQTDEDKYALINSCENLTTLQEGEKVLAMGIMGWAMGEVRVDGPLWSSPYVETRGSVFPLSMCEDDRACFVTSSQINKCLLQHEGEK